MSFLRKIISFVADTIQTFVLLGAVFVIIYLFFFQPHQVVGDSMVPNFHNAEYLLTDKISYRFRPPKTREVIIFKSPDNPEKDYIKRIIAVPGDKIRIEKGRIFINDQILDEDQYLASDVKTFPGRYIKEDQEYEVPPGSYFALGDNRMNSSDSREWGFVKKEDIRGRSFLVYWPPQVFRLIEPGKLF